MSTFQIPARATTKLSITRAGYTPYYQEISVLEDTTYNITLSILRRVLLMYWNSGTGVYYTDDAVAFTQATNYPSGYSGIGAAYDGEKFVTIGSGPKSWYSEDGSAWIASPNNLAYNCGTNGSIAYGNGAFVYGNYGYNHYNYSADGINWQDKQWSLDSLYDGIFANGMFVFHNGNPMNKIAISTDGINWTDKTLDMYPSKINYANGQFFLFPNNVQTFYTTTDFETYTSYSGPTPNGSGAIILYNNGTYLVTYTNSYNYWLSTDLTNWTVYTFPSSVKPRCALAAYGKYIVVNTYGWTQVSDDGINWQTRLNVYALFNYATSNM